MEKNKLKWSNKEKNSDIIQSKNLLTAMQQGEVER